LRIVTFNMLFAGHSDSGFGAPNRWDAQMAFLRALAPDVLLLQEANGFDLLGRRRLHQAVNDLDMARGFLAEANQTTSGHKFHTAILTSSRVRVAAEGADTLRYHHVLGWARLLMPGAERPLELRHLHLDPFDPRNRSREVAPLEVLAAPETWSILAGDFNCIGVDQHEPDWSVLDRHLLNGHLRTPSDPHADRSDRDATQLLQRAGFTDAATAAGQGQNPTAAFGNGDVPRRQDLILTSPALTPLVTDYSVHCEPITDGFSDHCAVSIRLDLDRLGSGTH
jgi:endonuclease/exonuclease/phosphatase family metal-dependent hydrolase